jgi:hypothetical protein
MVAHEGKNSKPCPNKIGHSLSGEVPQLISGRKKPGDLENGPKVGAKI